MNNQFNLWVILPYVVLIIIATIFATTKIVNCGKPVIIPVQRDTLIQQKVDSLTSLLQLNNTKLQTLNDALLINQTGIDINRQNYGKKKQELKQQASSKDYEETLNYLNSYK